MSRSSMIFFEDGKPCRDEEFSNSWGGAARIWTALYDKYLKDPLIEYDSWLGSIGSGKDDLWDLANRDDLQMFERTVHASTFDYAIIRKKNFSQFAKDLRDFVDLYPPGESVCHLLKWAGIVESSEAEAIGFHATSVTENLWYIWDDESEEDAPYNLKNGNKHFEVYEHLMEE